MADDESVPVPRAEYWPVPAPDVPAVDVARLRAAFRGGSFKSGSSSPVDPGRRGGVLRRYCFPGSLPPLTVGWWAVVFYAHPPLYVAIPMFVLAIPLSFIAFAGLWVLVERISKRTSRRGRVLVRRQGQWALPDALEPSELLLVERAVAALDGLDGSTSVAQDRLRPDPRLPDRTRYAEVLWQIATRAGQVSELRRAVGTSPFDRDESLVDLLAPAVNAVEQASGSLVARVEGTETYAAQVAAADDALATLARLREVGDSNDRVARIITEMRWDRPSLDSTLLSARITAAEENWDRLVAKAAADFPGE